MNLGMDKKDIGIDITKELVEIFKHKDARIKELEEELYKKNEDLCSEMLNSKLLNQQLKEAKEVIDLFQDNKCGETEWAGDKYIRISEYVFEKARGYQAKYEGE